LSVLVPFSTVARTLVFGKGRIDGVLREVLRVSVDCVVEVTCLAVEAEFLFNCNFSRSGILGLRLGKGRSFSGDLFWSKLFGLIVVVICLERTLTYEALGDN